MPSNSEKFRSVCKTVGLLTACALFAMVFAVPNCRGAAEPPATSTATPSFNADIAPILQKNCVVCHSSTAKMGGLVMDSYGTLIAGGKHGQPIVPHNADGSRLIQMLEGKIQPQMPFDSDPLSAADIATIKTWINAGAIGPPAAAEATKSPTPMATPMVTPSIQPGTATAATTPTFDADIVPILQKNCLACHSSTAKMGGLVMASYSTLLTGGSHGQVIIPHNADGSRIIQMLEGKIQPQMPYGSDPLPAADIATIKAWINAGAVGPSAGEATKLLTPLATPNIQPEVAVVSPIASVKFSPDGKLLAVGGYRQVRLLDPVTGKVIATLSGHADYVRSIAFSPDGKMLAAGGGPPQRGGEIKIWDVQSHQLLKTMVGHKDCIYSIAWSPDGKLIASASYDKSAKLWDVASGKELFNLQEHIDAVFAVAFSPDGKRLATASQDRTVKIWDVATGKRLYTLGDATDGLTSVAYSPSGDQIAAAGYDKTIYIWQLGKEDGHLRQSLIADEDSILSLVWSPDGKTIITASSDGSIRFRDAATLDPLSVINHQSDWVETLGISPDGTSLAAGRYNGTLSLYNAATYKETRGQLVVFDTHQPAAENETKRAAIE